MNTDKNKGVICVYLRLSAAQNDFFTASKGAVHTVVLEQLQ
jgi:hypothetical protein